MSFRSSKNTFMAWFLAFVIMAPVCCFAQKGDRKGHDNMAMVVPEELIPPAPFLSPEEALETFEVAPGFVIEPVVTEPLVEMPVALKFDPDGRMWVCEMKGYMPDIDGNGEDIPQGRIVILEDTDDDGQVDKRTIFLDELLLPRALLLTNDGVLFADQKNLLFIERDGLQPIGKAEVIDEKYAKGGNVEHKANGLLMGLDNWIYSSKSHRRYRRVNGQWEQESTLFRGQWGLSKDNYGRLAYNNNSLLLYLDRLLPNTLSHNPGAKMKVNMGEKAGSSRVWPARVTPGLNRAYISKINGYDSSTLNPETFKLSYATGACGPEIYRGDNFPKTNETLAYVCESSAQLVKAIAVDSSKGKVSASHPYGKNEFLRSTDERFRPVNAYTAPDGTLYVLDMYHGIIQHKTFVTSYLREYILRQGLDKPSHGHGRIYRIRHASTPRAEKPNLSQASQAELINTLGHPNGWWRDTAQDLLIQAGDLSAQESLEKLLQDPSQPLRQLHALWTLEGLKILNPTHISSLLEKSSNHSVLASALTAAMSFTPSDLSILEEPIIQLSATGDLLTYRNLLLTTIGSDQSLDAAISTLEENENNTYLAAATISGLGGKEDQFLKINNNRIKDKKFHQWLTSSKKSSNPDSQAQKTKLTGNHLASFEKGKELYQTAAACIGCHGADGAGLPNLGPPLDESEWVTGSDERLIKILLHGMYGPLKVNGIQYEPAAAMPGLVANPTMDDEAIADIATYIRHEWDNAAPMVDPNLVKKVRAKTKERAGRPYTEKEVR